MEIKILSKRNWLIILIIFFGLVPILSAQTAGYFTETVDGELRYFQRFVWSGGENALRYDIIFERDFSGTFVPYLREFTTLHYIEVSLPPGFYRVQVTPYDILDRAWEESEWRYVQILPAPAWFDEELPEHVPEFKIELDEMEYEFDWGFTQEPEYIIDWEPEQTTGIWQTTDTWHRPERVDSPKPMLFNIGLTWAPLIPVYGDVFNLSLISAQLHLNMTFLIPMNIYIGPEITLFFAAYDKFFDSFDNYYLSIGINFLAIKWLSNMKTGIGFKIGANYSIYPSGGNGFSLGQIIPCVGLLLRQRITNSFLIEAGLDFMNRFGDVSGGVIRPRIGVGIQY